MSIRDVFGTDLALLHAPSVYDFRTSVIMHGFSPRFRPVQTKIIDPLDANYPHTGRSGSLVLANGVEAGRLGAPGRFAGRGGVAGGQRCLAAWAGLCRAAGEAH